MCLFTYPEIPLQWCHISIKLLSQDLLHLREVLEHDGFQIFKLAPFERGLQNLVGDGPPDVVIDRIVIGSVPKLFVELIKCCDKLLLCLKLDNAHANKVVERVSETICEEGRLVLSEHGVKHSQDIAML